MKLIVGLGNPGVEYQFTPHNLGFLAVDGIAERCGVKLTNRRCRAITATATYGGEQVLLAKPETFMNLSGVAVRELVQEYEAEADKDLIVIYDELDLPFGQLRIRERGGPAGHNGMKSIIGSLGSQEFTRIRLGVAPDQDGRRGADFLLSPFKRAHYEALGDVLDRSAEAVRVILTDGTKSAMNQFNRKTDPAGGPE